MKKTLLVVLTIVLGLNCYAQISYKKGYYINNSNEKVECFIKNIGWNNNPSEIEYKLTENSDKKNITVAFVKEFGIYNICKYTRHLVKIDNSSDNLKELRKKREPIFTEEKLLLKVLVEGEANLYSYKVSNSNKYFYSKGSSEIKQLIFKTYLNKGNKIVYNNSYRQQLLTDLKCPNFTISKIENIDYKQSELINFFIEYNECNNHGFINYEKKQNRDLFNLTIRPGINTSSLYIENGISYVNDADFDESTALRFGVEIEFIMPFYENKWAIIMEPTYQYFKSEKEITAYFETQKVKVDYKSIELPIGVRHYIFLNDNSKFFFNASFTADLNRGSVIDYESENDLEIKTSNNIALGVGYKYNDRFCLEFRYHTKRQVLKNYANWQSAYKTSSVILGYTLF